MQILAGHLLFSATDLVNFLGCRHATYLDLRDLTNPAEIPERDAATVLIDCGATSLVGLKAQGFDPNRIELGLKHGLSVPEGLNSGSAVGLLLDKKMPGISRSQPYLALAE